MNLQSDPTAERDGRIGFGEIIREQPIEPQANSWPFAADDVIVPVAGFDRSFDGCGIRPGSEKLRAAAFIIETAPIVNGHVGLITRHITAVRNSLTAELNPAVAFTRVQTNAEA